MPILKILENFFKGVENFLWKVLLGFLYKNAFLIFCFCTMSNFSLVIETFTWWSYIAIENELCIQNSSKQQQQQQVYKDVLLMLLIW